MSERSLHKLDPSHPDELCAARGLVFEDEQIQAAAAQTDAAGFLGWLVEHEHYAEAIRYLAHALPPREGVWWACVSARRALGREPWPEEVAALEAAEAWVFKPADDGLRRTAMAAANATDMQSAASLAAVACFFSGGSLAPPGAPPHPPGETMCPTMVSAAVLHACSKGSAERAPERFRLLLEVGMDIASGGSGKNV